ncbi:MAG TPA: heme exporter protein CcmB [Candidatus Limnocylindrales bacterium]|nr:heme exporter protein CcmB [Candidatus Limnocylindrales bacterium]
MKGTPFFAAVAAIFRKDVRAELRSRELIGSMGLFALLAVLVFSFALDLNREGKLDAISGVLWVTLIFASILGLNRSMAMERDQGNLDALLLAPISRSAIYIGKLAGNLVFVLAVAIVLAITITVLFNAALFDPRLLLVMALGSIGYSTVGTLLAAMSVQTRARESLLPIIMLPIALPLLLSAVRATSALLTGAPEDQWLPWLSILAVLDVIFLVLSFLLFEFVVED